MTGYQTLAAHFPSGLTDPTRVVAATDRAAEVQRAITATPGVVSATETRAVAERAPPSGRWC